MTTQEKIAIYKKALEYINSGLISWMCLAIIAACNTVLNKTISIYSVFNLFPELIQYKPARLKDKMEAWWPASAYGKRNRIRVLKNIIQKLENEEDIVNLK